MKSKTTRTFKINSLILKELEELCNELEISMTSFIEIAIVEKMAKIRSYSVKNSELDKIYDFAKNIARNG